MSDLLDSIERLRPVTSDKLLDPNWQQDYTFNVNDKMRSLLAKIEDEEIKEVNTYAAIEEVPNFTIEGLPGFNYPNHRIPALMKLNRPKNINTRGGTGVSLSESNDNLHMSYNVDGVDSTFGILNQTYMNFSSSPLEGIYDFLCGGMVFNITGGFSVQAGISINLPNLAFSPMITLNIDPCLSQFLPPLALPTIELPTITLGNGIEFGVYVGGDLAANNFGTGFGIGGIVDFPAMSLPAEFKAIPSVDWKHGMTLDVTFPAYGKGLEWSKNDEK